MGAGVSADAGQAEVLRGDVYREKAEQVGKKGWEEASWFATGTGVAGAWGEWGSEGAGFTGAVR